jgi:hypothetical protein
MPFRNYAYSGERLFPIQENSSETIFRVWFNNGTSLDRVITVSRDTLFNNQGYYVEFGLIMKKSFLSKEKARDFFHYERLTPNSGYDKFFKKLDSLEIMDLKNQTGFESALHEVYSLYVVEYKKSGKYNQFSFRTHFKDSTSTGYTRIQQMLFKEFDWKYYLK